MGPSPQQQGAAGGPYGLSYLIARATSPRAGLTGIAHAMDRAGICL